jgi:hypothetical protein
MGVELQSMQTALTVEQALEMLGLRVTRLGAKKTKAASDQAKDWSDPARERDDEGQAGPREREMAGPPLSLAGRTEGDNGPSGALSRPPRR